MKTLILSATLAAATALAPITAQAGSGGQIAVNIQPRTAEEARMMRLGLALYALHQDADRNGHVTQQGVNNAAGLYQGGPNNQAVIHQEGCNHTGTVHQQNGHNAAGLFQFGCNTNGHIAQNGAQTGITLLFGW